MMANLYPPSYPPQHHLDFHPRPVNHSPSPLGFGFGLASSTPNSPFSPGPFTHHNHQTTQRPQKRRHDEEEEHARRGDEMDRSPTPERPKRAAPKRLRVMNQEVGGKENDRDANSSKDSKRPSSDVDVGVLLASLPQQSLLPLLMALIREKPDLKPTVLSLLPRPTLETALRTLAEASKSLRDAYPYSAPSPSIPSATFGFGSATFGQRPTSVGFGSFSRGASPSQSHSQASSSSGGMRDSYILSRLRPHISDFVSTCFSYLPYFSYLPPPPGSSTSQSAPPVKPHAAETFTYLSNLTSHVFSQPQLTRNELCSLLSPRLQQEWKAWVDRVDEVVNREGGMFSGEVARGWERHLDEFAEKDGSVMKEIRDMWVTKVGWLVGRRVTMNMDEDEDL